MQLQSVRAFHRYYFAFLVAVDIMAVRQENNAIQSNINNPSRCYQKLEFSVDLKLFRFDFFSINQKLFFLDIFQNG